MKHVLIQPLLCVLLAFAGPQVGTAIEDKPEALVNCPVAIIGVRERGSEVRGLGDRAFDLLTANLLKDPALWLVDREDLQKTLAEQELSLSGTVSAEEAVTVGRVTGAKLLISGSIFQVDDSLHFVAKIIGTETTRMVGVSAKASLEDGVETLTKQIAAEVAKSIKENASQLIVAAPDRSDHIKSLKERLGTALLPTVSVAINEKRNPTYQARAVKEAVAEGEITRICNEVGFSVIDASGGKQSRATIVIKGDATSEFLKRRGNLIASKASIEVKAIDRATGKVIATDRQTIVSVDLAEQSAEKSALQTAAGELVERLLPKLVKNK